MSTPEDVAAQLSQVLSDGGVDKKTEDSKSQLDILLATGSELDRKIVDMGQNPRLLDCVKDDSGNVLINKYEKLTKPIWQKYRGKPQCRPLHFICDTPLFVIDDVNATFLIGDDFQFLGMVYHMGKNDAVADEFFTEALKANTADANINAAVFRYRRGERGPRDNFYLAKKHFTKALAILHEMPLTVDEKRERRRLCELSIDEIDYRFAPLLDKFFRFIIRMLTLRFETEVWFVGAAAPKEPRERKYLDIRGSIDKREFDLKKLAYKKFVNDLQEKIPVGQSHIEAELQEIVHQFGEVPPTAEVLDQAVFRLGDFYAEHISLIERSGQAEAVERGVQSAIPPLQRACYELAATADIEKLAEKHKLTSIGELVDMATRANIDGPMLAWMLRDKADQSAILERLAANPSVPEDVKKAIRQHLSFLG